MSGLYNTIFGVNKLAGPLLASIDVNFRDVPRFRDCFLNKDGTEIIIYTRVGGGNRAEYDEPIKAMRQLPGYLRDEDDGYDETYASFFFAIPEAERENCRKLAALGFGVDPAQRWADFIDDLGKTDAQSNG